MLGTERSFRLLRSSIASCLALLLSCASLAPAAARVFDALGQTCCHGRAKTCCRKAHVKTTEGLSISGRLCGSDCGQMAVRAISASGLDRPQSNSVAPSAEDCGRVLASDYAPQKRFLEIFRRQRPPPAFPTA